MIGGKRRVGQDVRRDCLRHAKKGGRRYAARENGFRQSFSRASNTSIAKAAMIRVMASTARASVVIPQESDGRGRLSIRHYTRVAGRAIWISTQAARYAVQRRGQLTIISST
jgi:hypothetical protein